MDIRKVKKLIELTSIEVYRHLITLKAQRSTSKERWESHVGMGFTEEDWAGIYHLSYLICRDTKVIAFQMKITHRILACKHNLSKLKIENNGICNRCQEDKDIIMRHLLPSKTNMVNL